MLTVACQLLYFVTVFEICRGSGHLSLLMVSFRNPRGQNYDGDTCDDFFEHTGCDHRFIICLDKFNGFPSVTSCPYGKRSTGAIRNKNIIHFGNSISGVANPMLFPFVNWPGSLMIKVEIWDRDEFSDDDYVDFLDYIYRATPAFTSAAQVPHIVSSDLTTLQFKLNVYCDQDYFGVNCTTYCRSRDDNFGHYTCDTDSGSKICLKGWQGRNCNVQIQTNHCQSSPCSNSGTCLNSDGGYRCLCVEGFTGTRCDIENLCHFNPCKNGGTCQTLEAGTFRCQCTDGWMDSTCSLRVPTTNSRDKVIDCDQDYFGVNCSTYCQSRDDNFGHYTCDTDSGSKICLKGWQGRDCNVQIQTNHCQSSPCSNSGTCLNSDGGYRCLCVEGFNGTRCDIEDLCHFNPCKNGGTCQTLEAGTFRCQCTDGWMDSTCSLRVPTTNSRDKGIDCDQDYFGVNCTTYCRSRDDNFGHYTCDTNSGSKICLKGWQGRDCNVQIQTNHCQSSPCSNSGTCLNSDGGYRCLCVEGFTGTRCDIENLCHFNPCKNGGTCQTLEAGTFRCQCTDEWMDPTCSLRVPTTNSKDEGSFQLLIIHIGATLSVLSTI